MPDLYTGKLRDIPAWANKAGALFAWEGITWRIESVGCHNNTLERGHICGCNLNTPRDAEGHWTCACPPRLRSWVEYVLALPVNQAPQTLPKAPCTTTELAESIDTYLHQVRRFTPDVLEKVLRTVRLSEIAVRGSVPETPDEPGA
jgi:hypothetical protein